MYKKVMVIGSGPIVIGQAAEFDYSGTQACRSLKEEGVEVVLVNNNPATIMTDSDIADKVYMEPLTVKSLTEIIEKEKPDGLLPTLGGQTGLNLAVELYESGVLDKYNLKLMGNSISSIKKAEDRDEFKLTMEKINEPVIKSDTANDLEKAICIANDIGYPVIVRPAYTLGGTGGGIANTEKELIKIASEGLALSLTHQVLIEKSVYGWKEIEYEVMRDKKGNTITVCNMENIDPVGIHTGDSIVVAPSQTLSDKEYQMLRTSALKIINELGIEGGCNVQFALDPKSFRYYVIEVNPRVSRSSALASKATGYPIAKVAAKIALGYGLDEIINPVTGKTYACFEPALDYVVVKIPRWPFDKFYSADRKLGTQMKATGEVMAIGNSFEAALLKGLRSLEIGSYHLKLDYLRDFSKEELLEMLDVNDDRRLFIIGQALRSGIGIDEIHEKTFIDKFFLNKLLNIISIENEIKQYGINHETMKKAKKYGFCDKEIADLTNTDERYIRNIRYEMNIHPSYKMVDTCAAEFVAVSPFYYSAYEVVKSDDINITQNEKVLCIGSGPIRIGQGIEFDYCLVHSIWALKKSGYDAIVINNNPETVSTDADISDGLFFEPLTIEDILEIINKIKPKGVVVQFGGQTAIKLANELKSLGINIIGTDPDSIDIAEDRKRFDALLEKLGMKRPNGISVTNKEDAIKKAGEIGYPVLIRPSYVLGGQGMQIIHSADDLKKYIEKAISLSDNHPLLIDKYLMGKEVEVDAISDGCDTFIPGIMEHLERAGIHSGDSISIYPPISISEEYKNKIIDYTTKLAKELNVKGIINVQYVIYDDLYIIEVNPRSSRTVPYMSKVTGVPMIDLATYVSLGKKLKDMGYDKGLYKESKQYAVKVPVFSFQKLPKVDSALGPEMKSTGEAIGLSDDLTLALYKGMTGAGISIPEEGGVLITVADADKDEMLDLAKDIYNMGFKIYATKGTYDYLTQNGIQAVKAGKISEAKNDLRLDALMEDGEIKLVINTPTKGSEPIRDGYNIRNTAMRLRIPCMTSLDTAKGLIACIKRLKKEKLV